MMKRNILLFTLTFTLLIIQYHSSFAARYYFSSSGDDSRTAAQAQNPDTPWRTINKLNAVMRSLQPGDEVLFKRGDVFVGTIEVSRAGNPGRPLVFGAYGSGPKPIITSLVTVTNWTHVGGGVYESHHSSLPSSLNVVLLNDSAQEMGRFPNSDAPNNGYLTFNATNGHNNITADGLNGNWSGGEIVIRKSHFTIDSYPILSHLGKIISFSKSNDTYNPQKGFGYFIQGHPNTLDKQGEWYYNRLSKKLRVHFGSASPASARVEVATLDHLVKNARGVGDVLFDNIHFKGANEDIFHIFYSKNFHIRDCDLEYAGDNGVFGQEASHITIERSRFNDINSNGINLHNNTPNATIKDNTIHNINIIPGLGKNGVGSGYGITTGSDNNVIENNELKNIGYIGIRFGGNSSVVKNNFIDNFCLIKDDGAGIYTWVGAANRNYHGRKIIGNIILNGVGAIEGTPTTASQVEGIYLDDNVSGVEIADNVVAHMVGKGMYIHNTRDVTVRNNVLYNNEIQFRMSHDYLGHAIRNVTVVDNVFFSKHIDQITSSIGTVKNDIREMGSFDRNHYVRPFEDIQTIAAQKNENGNRISQVLDLAAWREGYGKDNGSKTSPVTIPAYKVISVDKVNKYPHGSYDDQKSASSGIHATRANLSWNGGGKLDGGALQVAGQSSSFYVTMTVGALKRNTHYVLRMSGISNKGAVVKALLMQNNSPYGLLAPKTTFKFNPQRGEYEAVFFIENDEGSASLRLEAEGQGVTFWIDNVVLSEAQAEKNHPADFIRFEYNPTKQEKSIALDAVYVDAKNTKYSGNITLAPYSGKVLIRTSDIAAPVERPNINPTVRILTPRNNQEFKLGSEIQIEAEAKDEDGSVSKVEFFHGDQLIGTATSSPFKMVWKGAAAGEYAITARATDNKGAAGGSDPVRAKVLSPAPSEKPDKPEDVVTPPGSGDASGFSLYLNAGSSQDVNHDGKLFKGDAGMTSYYNNSHSAYDQSASNQELFQSERNAFRLNYAIPVPNGVYTVTTYHHETWWGKDGRPGGAGNRVFNIKLEDEVVKDGFDIFTENNNKETTMTFSRVEVKDGILNIDLESTKDRASIAGIAIEGAGANSPNPPVSELPVTDPDFTLYLNTGSDVDVVYEDKLFKGDRQFRSYYNFSYEAVNERSSSDPLFQSERNAFRLNYTIPVPNGTYTIRTYHNEIWWGWDGLNAGPGDRVFDIRIEGDVVKEKFDMFDESSNRQTVLRFTEIEVTDGKLNLDFIASKDRASVSGIAIEGFFKNRAPASKNGFSLHLNTGSSQDVQFDGKLFVGDGKQRNLFNFSHEAVTPWASKDELYQTERNAFNLNYTIPVPNGIYTVQTHHNELWWGKAGSPAGPGKRVFNILLEGDLVKSGFDLYKEANNRETVLTFKNVEVKDGVLNLSMIALKDRVSISGISIYAEETGGSANLRMAVVEAESEPSDVQANEVYTDTKLFPNPASGSTNLVSGQELDLNYILIHDMSGQLIKQLDADHLNNGAGQYSIPLDGISRGVYLVSLVGRKEMIKQLRLVVNP